ncbi:MAG: hypothetical protein GY889_09380 [Proteobacteria bacterium]|nr:hypothetical protein [Pseudomonadota bacterium]
MKNALAEQTVNAWTYPLTVHAGHLLIDTEFGRYLIDTGSPVSLAETPVCLAARNFSAASSTLGISSIESIVEMVGTPFDALIGTDVLENFDIEISLAEGTLSLSEEFIDVTSGPSVEFIAGVPLIDCEVAGRTAQCFLDTGAPLSYLPGEWLRSAPSLGEIEDFHPLLGRFRVDTHAILMHCLGKKVTLRVGCMPSLLESAMGIAGASGIIGTQMFEQGVLSLSQRQQRAKFI